MIALLSILAALVVASPFLGFIYYHEKKKNQSKGLKKYSHFSMIYENRYSGVYMLMGLHAIEKRWYLIRQTLMPTDAQKWADEFKIPMASCTI